MSEHISKSHNKNLLLYHLVCPAKYRRKVFTEEVEKTLVKVCEGISCRHEIYFVEIGADQDHLHFLVQSVPIMSPTKIAQIIKGITAREIYMAHPEIKKMLWGGHIWTAGFYINTVGASGNEQVIQQYVVGQGMSYTKVYRSPQLSLYFD
jgi:REP element-mobilizing transposase RayT